jgi:hypothetical protein
MGVTFNAADDDIAEVGDRFSVALNDFESVARRVEACKPGRRSVTTRWHSFDEVL